MTAKRVLLVDDEELFVTMLAKRMTRRGLDVETAYSGEEAVDKARERSFDAVVLDLAMPGIDGIETLKQLIAIQPEVQVILLSGHGTVHSSVEAMKLGAVDFLEKPVELDVLLATVDEAASRRSKAIEQHSEEQVADILKKQGW